MTNEDTAQTISDINLARKRNLRLVQANATALYFCIGVDHLSKMLGEDEVKAVIAALKDLAADNMARQIVADIMKVDPEDLEENNETHESNSDRLTKRSSCKYCS